MKIQTRAEKIARNRAEKRIEAAYGLACSGVQIDIMAIPRVFAEGHRLIAAGADNAALAAGLRAFVDTL